MMSLKSRSELVEVVQPWYLKASKLEQKFLDEFTYATGYHRKHAIRVLKNKVHAIGYDRWETQHELTLLECVYDDLRSYINFFQPSLKLIAKERIDNRTSKRYDTAKTPYQRILERKDISLEAKARLTHVYLQLNPAVSGISATHHALFWIFEKAMNTSASNVDINRY